jgi:hypothetical protein
MIFRVPLARRKSKQSQVKNKGLPEFQPGAIMTMARHAASVTDQEGAGI